MRVDPLDYHLLLSKIRPFQKLKDISIQEEERQWKRPAKIKWTRTAEHHITNKRGSKRRLTPCQFTSNLLSPSTYPLPFLSLHRFTTFYTALIKAFFAMLLSTSLVVQVATTLLTFSAGVNAAAANRRATTCNGHSEVRSAPLFVL
jgi:hypothetical protein